MKIQPIDVLRTSFQNDQVALDEDMRYWGDLASIERALARIRKVHTTASGIPSDAQSREVVEQFLSTNLIRDRRMLRILAYGLNLAVDDGTRSILSSSAHLQLVLASTSQLRLKQRLTILLGLSHSYLSFSEDLTARDGWEAGIRTLKSFLAKQADACVDAVGSKPRWLQCLCANRQIFTDRPGDRFGAQLAMGNMEPFQEFRGLLSVTQDSWLVSEVILGQVRATCQSKDALFLEKLRPLVESFELDSSAKPSERVARVGLGMLLHRYTTLASPTEHERLRDAALSRIGNPWLRPQLWAQYVLRPDGTASDEACSMVTSWLKQRLIRDFFEVLGSDRSADARRLAYWLKHEKAIEDLWLFLGDDAWYSARESFKEIKKRAQGRVLNLINAQSSANNAFAMKISGLLVIEFGLTGNACYVYNERAFPSRLEAGGKIRGETELKVKRLALHWLPHVDRADGPWEWHFDEALSEHLPTRNVKHGRQLHEPKRRSQPDLATPEVPRAPSAPPTVPLTYRREVLRPSPATGNQDFSSTRLTALQHQYGFKLNDKRDKGGALWAEATDADSVLAHELTKIGFKYKSGRGWWFQDQ